MSRTLFGYALKLYVLLAFAIFAVVMAVFLVADFGDRMKAFVEHPWRDVLELYFNKALVAAHQLGPAALLLAAGAGVSTLRKRGELTALRSLSFGPAALYLPVALGAFLGAVALIAFDERVVTQAGAKVDEITVQRFKVWGDWRYHYEKKRWFRSGEQIFHLREGDVEQGFEKVTLFSLGPDFELRARLDAEKMSHAGGTRWRLEKAVERSFLPGGQTSLSAFDVQERELGVPVSAFRILLGRPEQMRVSQLAEQIEARKKVGLPAARFVLALHNRFAYPLMGFAAALVAVGMALRPGRKGHLTAALLEGLLVAVALWGLLVVSKSLVLSDRLAAPVAAWLPFVLLLSVALVLWLRREGKLGRGGI